MITLTPAYLAILVLGASVLILSVCVWHLHRVQRREAARAARLEDILSRMTREVIAANARLARSERSIQHMGDRQDTLECRTAGGQRIESAVRVARQGAASEAVLKDLGLSDAEASLLLRLHTDQSETEVTPAATIVTDESISNEARPNADEPRRPASQAASLARLLAASGQGPEAA
ncbi:MAG: DUF2802 domain-containing protein [Gammaproteobacteria bacterium]